MSKYCLWVVVASIFVVISIAATTSESQDYLSHGNAAFDQGRFEEALHLFSRAVKLDRFNHRYLYHAVMGTVDVAKCVQRLE